MLRDVKESACHLLRRDACYHDDRDFMQIKTEFMNLSGTSSNASGGGGSSNGEVPRGAGGVKSTRSGYKEEALAAIRNSLQPYANCDRSVSSASSTTSESGIYTNHSGSLGSHHGISSTSGGSSSGSHHGLHLRSGAATGIATSNGQAERDLNLQRQVLKQLISMGYSEDVACRLLRLSNMKDDLLDSNEGKEFMNGQPPPPPPPVPLGLKPLRKGSIQENYVWESRASSSQTDCNSSNASVRSDSPGMSNNIAGLHRPPPQPNDANHPANFVAFYRMQQQQQQNANYNSANEAPPLPPPRGLPPPPTPPRGTTPPTPPPLPPSLSNNNNNLNHQPQLFKRRSPVPQSRNASATASPQRGTSPVSCGGRNSVGSIMSQQNLQQMLSRYSAGSTTSGGSSSRGVEPPPPYPSCSSPSPASYSSIYSSPPPSYASSSSGRQSPTPTISSSEYSIPLPPFSQKRTTGSSPGTPSALVTSVMPRPTPLQAWSVKQSQSPVIMQSVKSTQVQKPILQTAVAPTSPPPAPSNGALPNGVVMGIATQPMTYYPQGVISGYATAVPATAAIAAESYLPPYTAIRKARPVYGKASPPNYSTALQHLPEPAHVNPPPAYPNQNYQDQGVPHHRFGELKISDYHGSPPPPPPVPPTDLPPVVPTTDPPSYASTVTVLSGQIVSQSPIQPVNNNLHCYATQDNRTMLDNFPLGNTTSDLVSTVESICHSAAHCEHPMLQRKNSPIAMDTASSRSASRSESPVSHGLSQSPVSFMSTSPSTQSSGTNSGRAAAPPPPYKMSHQSPIPPRKILSKEKEEEKRETKVKNFSPAAFKFFMEQHVESLLKSQEQREHRRQQLEMEMAKVGLSDEAQCQMRMMLHQKESNYIRLKRAKMDKSMFFKIKAIGVGAFGEVALVKKTGTNQLYAMKTLRKNDVLKRNQVAHVKAERDILAEADNEWVVKLYYSFQDQDYLYFVMDYIPGGDLMSLLIKFSIFQEPLAKFYIAELVLAVESVHKMGFIHRDIKPDNILIDSDGHIKLTDFGLCTGFRWTHNSKYYQRNGEHARQDSMEPEEGWSNECHCYANTSLKPLERRRRKEHQRCLAHSLVGTPNYIAPEVLLRTGYTQLCDWWSVGVILYEMLVGQPPFLANTPVETQIKVINWESSLHIPKAAKLTPESADLIMNLCCGPEKRIGRNGAPEIKAHSFFNGMDLEGGCLRKQVAPYIPQILNPTDTSNFDPIDSDKLLKSGSNFNSNAKSNDNGDCYENGKHPEHAFFEFTFRRFFDDGGQAYPVRISLDNNHSNGGMAEQQQNEDGTQGSPVYV